MPRDKPSVGDMQLTTKEEKFRKIDNQIRQACVAFSDKHLHRQKIDRPNNFNSFFNKFHDKNF